MNETQLAKRMIEMTQHTQGPWKDYGHAGQINGADNSYICQVESKNTKADIALIAAAPELLALLTRMRKEIREAVELIKSSDGFRGQCTTTEDLADMALIRALNDFNRTIDKTGLDIPNGSDAAIAKAEGR